MNQRNPIIAMMQEPFIAGTDKSKDLFPLMHRLWKLEGGAIYLCRKGWAQVTINLQEYEIVENSQVVLMPGSILRVNGASDDFSIDYLAFSTDIFREASIRLESSFFGFLIENPCYVLPVENTKSIDGLMRSTTLIYDDQENRFRNQIAKNHLQCFLWDIYDKCHRYFSIQQIEGKNRQDEVFKKFMNLVHDYCSSQREVTFYANELCISTKYLTGICRSVTGAPAKKIIDDFAILEIKVLLQSTELTIQEIADRLGFPDQSYLGRYFKRHEGMSPREYQNTSKI